MKGTSGMYILGRIPDGEQTFGYSKTYDARSALDPQFSRPIPTLVMIRAKPVSQKRNDHTPFTPKNQRV